MREPFPRPKRRWIRVFQGALMSLGAPLGWWMLSHTFGLHDADVPRYFLWLYIYMTLGTAFVLTAFGYVIGSSEEQAARTALTDHLTSLFNTRYFHDRLEMEFANAKRYGTHLTLLLLDLDHFKRVNDTYGHPAGDVVLQVVARTISSASRTGDTVARVGGEEFALILPETDTEGGKALAERIRLAVAEKPIRLPIGFGINVHVSIGVAGTETITAQTATALFATVDQALYEAKETGRNRVVVARTAAQTEAA